MFEKIKLYPKQQSAIETNARVTIFVSGIRGGKTVGAGAHFTIKRIIKRPNEKGLIFSNTSKQLNTSTLHEFMKVLAYYEMHEGQAYVKNKDPFRYFGYKSMFDNHSGVWSFWNGAQILTFSLESQMRGTEFGYAWGDEVQDAKKSKLDIVMGRLSGSGRPQILYTLTPPRKNPDVTQMVYPKDVELTKLADKVFHDPDSNVLYIYGSTYDNEQNLPEGYIDMLRNTYDPITFEREVMGQEVTSVNNRFAYCFEDRHISDKAKYDPKQLVYLSLDFNVNPATCIAWHQGRRTQPYIHYFDEIVIPDSNVYRMCEHINAKYGHNQLMLTGDATALKREFTQRSNTLNTWRIIKQELKLSEGQVKLKPNPKTENVMVLCNSILSNHPEILFNPSMVNTIRDMRFVQVDEYNKILKKNRSDVYQQADLLDCFKYSVNTFHSDFVDKIRRKAV